MTAEYQITSLKDFFAIPPESIDACLADFKKWIELARAPNTLTEDFNTLVGIESAVTFRDDSFVWIDDGIVGITRIELRDGKTGEAVRISIEDDAA
jgi:hypothetical protein